MESKNDNGSPSGAAVQKIFKITKQKRWAEGTISLEMISQKPP